MTLTYNQKYDSLNEFLALENPYKVVSYVSLLLWVLKLLQHLTLDSGQLKFVQYDRHSGNPAWLPQEIQVKKLCLWKNVNNYIINLPNN